MCNQHFLYIGINQTALHIHLTHNKFRGKKEHKMFFLRRTTHTHRIQKKRTIITVYKESISEANLEDNNNNNNIILVVVTTHTKLLHVSAMAYTTYTHIHTVLVIYLGACTNYSFSWIKKKSKLSPSTDNGHAWIFLQNACPQQQQQKTTKKIMVLSLNSV